ncbi:ARID DNA-binding domain-containing protein [Tanacetum coccineum]
MVNYKHVIKKNWLQYHPVQHWYQSHGSEPWEKPIHKHDQVIHTRRYLQRETPKRLFPWNSRKKSLSPESKKILWKKMKEVEAFNASKLSAKVKDHGERSARTLKENRARCYICKIRGHVFWKCPNKKREAMIEQQKKLVKPTVKKIEERVKYPEKVHIITDYMVEGTDDASWDRIWMVGKEETERKFIFSYGVGEVTMDTRDRNLVIPSRTKITQEEETKKDDGSENVVVEHNKYLDEYFESIDPKEDCSLVKGLEDLKWDRNDVHDYVDEEYISWNGSLYAIKQKILGYGKMVLFGLFE